MKEIVVDCKETFTNITELIRDHVKITVADNKEGFVFLYVPHTTAAVMILEDEELLKKDMEQFLERLAPRTLEYRHDDIRNRTVPPGERINGFSHLRALLVNGSSTTIPFMDGKLALGKWQSIFLVELDPFRKRTVYISMLTSSKHML